MNASLDSARGSTPASGRVGTLLEVFAGLAPKKQLIEALELACRVGKVARALTWNRAVSGVRSPEFEEAPFESLASLLEDNYLGRV